MPEFFSLKEFVSLLTRDNGLHVCVHDVEGVLEKKLLNLGIENVMHASSFCDAAKTTSYGYARCISHKNKANIKAISEKKSFCGFCPYGLFEAVKPVVIDDRVVCIIYVGQVIYDVERARERIERTCRETGVSKSLMLSELEKIPLADKREVCMEIANAIDSVIRLLYDKSEDSSNSSCHWVVKRMMEYAQMNFDKNLTLKQMSEMYFIEEKYLGRLFKKNIGNSFSEYVNMLRMKRAARLLRDTNEKVIDISDECGYNNVTYFNRVFEKNFKMTPTVYRTTFQR